MNLFFTQAVRWPRRDAFSSIGGPNSQALRRPRRVYGKLAHAGSVLKFFGPFQSERDEVTAFPRFYKQTLRGVYPERNTEILRSAQNGERRARHEISLGCGPTVLRNTIPAPLLLLALLLISLPACAQTSGGGQTTSEGSANSGTDTTIFSHPSGRFWLSGQMNFISQSSGSFPAAYNGPNSFGPEAQTATSRVLTLYTGLELNDGFQIIADIESAGGHGLSAGAGLGGFPDLDIVRTPDLGQTPYLARFLVEKTIALGGGSESNDRSFLSLSNSMPERRLEIWLGKFSTVDFFDVNPVGSDSHLQFLNWAVDNNAAYDYAANTRGYTWGAVMQFYDRYWALRFGEAMMPKVANGENLDADIARAHSENLELELNPSLIRHRATSVRLLWYVNHADMGNYRDAIDGFLSGQSSVPDVTLSRRQGRVKYGFGVNVYQELGDGARLYGRWGWNDGRNESFVYTEVDRTVSFGGDLAGSDWHRSFDKLGAAFVVDGISGDHRRYLALGGEGFILGDEG